MGLRKNAATLDPIEKENFVRAVLELKAETIPGHSLNRYDEFVATHVGVIDLSGVATVDGAHFRPGFFPWHREFLCKFEEALQSKVPGVSLPYWKWDSGVAADTNMIFQDDFLGPAGQVTSGYFAFNAPDPRPAWWPDGLEGWRIDSRLADGLGTTLRRNPRLDPNLNNGTPGSFGRITTAVDEVADAVDNDDTYQTFRPAIETPHGRIHVWVGGHMNPMSSPNDPVFFLHHANLDRIWAEWQRDHPGPENYAPHTGGDYGHNIDDYMWPWDGGQSITEARIGNINMRDILPAFSPSYTVTPRDVLSHFVRCGRYDTDPIIKIPEKIPEKIPFEKIPFEKIPEKIPDKIPEKIPKEIPDKIPKEIPEKIPEKIPERIPEKIPEKIPSSP